MRAWRCTSSDEEFYKVGRIYYEGKSGRLIDEDGDETFYPIGLQPDMDFEKISLELYLEEAIKIVNNLNK